MDGEGGGGGLGELVEVEEATSSVLGVMGSGVGNMNPAIATIVVGESGSVTL